MKADNIANYSSISFFEKIELIYTRVIRWLILSGIVIPMCLISMLFEKIWSTCGISIFWFNLAGLFAFKYKYINRLLSFKEKDTWKNIKTGEILKSLATGKNFTKFFLMNILAVFFLTTLDLMTLSSIFSSSIALILYALNPQCVKCNIATVFTIFGGLTIFGSGIILIKYYIIEKEKKEVHESLDKEIKILRGAIDELLSKDRLEKFLEHLKAQNKINRNEYENLIKFLNPEEYFKEWEKYHEKQAKICEKVWGKFLRNLLRNLKSGTTIKIEILPASQKDIEINILNDFIRKHKEHYEKFAEKIYKELKRILNENVNENFIILRESDVRTFKRMFSRLKRVFSETVLTPITIESFVMYKEQIEELKPFKKEKGKKEDFVDEIAENLLEELISSFVIQKVRKNKTNTNALENDANQDDQLYFKRR